ncbi:hypothetical protein AFE_1026 [Acidithiobacillus ferrooxidans ATCC 23270]|uniref:Uncharacterized protein n=1 Tax=Acidithiobacillus ferrooxidans (strain ATCC 23270 / DSM 14882 / CIP 104768 / NCIMB 8455) TaxID=243159 RepID=B7J7K1_ACIF2|nr:hypothetical protein AFE_1026 [Acidithiobacillus ferrooxidans ATCC 23270]
MLHGQIQIARIMEPAYVLIGNRASTLTAAA